MKGKGRGVVTTRGFTKGEFLCEYKGEMISYNEARKREKEYSKDPSIGCFMYYFEWRNKKMW